MCWVIESIGVSGRRVCHYSDVSQFDQADLAYPS